MVLKAKMIKRLCCVLAALTALAAWPACAEGTDPFGASYAAGTPAAPASTMSVAEMFGISEYNPYATPTATPIPTPTPEPAPIATPVIPAATAGDPFGIEADGAAGAESETEPAPTIAPGSTMYVAAGVMLIYETTSEDSRVLTTAPFGQQVTVSASQGEWARIQGEGGEVGFCKVAALSPSDPNTLSRQVYAQLPGVDIYESPSTSAGKLRTLALGDSVTMTAITADGLWARVTDGTGYGFASTVCFDDAPAAPGTPVWCAVGSTPVMVNPDAWTQITRLSFGQSVQLTGYVQGNSIAKIRTGAGYVAYCAASALTMANPITLNTPVYAQVDGDILYDAPISGAGQASVKKGASLTLLGVDSTQTWALVQYRNRSCYVPFIYLGQSGAGGVRAVVTTRETPLYRSPTEAVATLPQGTRLYLTGSAGAAAAVSTIGDAATPQYSGYVLLECLRAE